jgi:uncharacterized protein YdhG (YjbR/CyaY superfamily)
MNAKVQAYMAATPPAARRELKKIREAILAAAPGAEEHFSYRMPGFRLNGKTLIWYAAWKNHVSVYPMTDGIRKRFASELEGYKMSKGTVQFPLTEPIPLALIKKLVKGRAAELLQG